MVIYEHLYKHIMTIGHIFYFLQSVFTILIPIKTLRPEGQCFHTVMCYCCAKHIPNCPVIRKISVTLLDDSDTSS